MQLTYLALLGLVSVKASLKADVDCHETVEEDTDNQIYAAEETIEECSADVTEETCAEAAFSLANTEGAGKMACVMLHQGCNDDEAQAECTYHQQVAEAGEQGSDWDPRRCDNDHPDDFAGLITWSATGDNVWAEDYDCANDEASSEDDSATTMTAGLSALAMALFVNM